MEVLQTFQDLVNAFQRDPYPDISKRLDKLKILRKGIVRYRPEIRLALKQDLGKSDFESDSSEILIVLRELDKTLKNLQFWTQNKFVSSDFLLIGSQSYIRYEPKGVILILSPWNYPISLVLNPLIAAYSAGNRVLIKPSEFVSTCNRVLLKIISECFDSSEVIIVEGDHTLANSLCYLPFNMIFFTGSGKTAKKVLYAASQNLSYCALELGGKCPVIIDDHTNLKSIVQDIAFAKTLNSGQSCLAPDFVYLKEDQVEDFVRYWNEWINKMYGEDILNSEDYSRIINEKQFLRITEMVDLTLSSGAIALNEYKVDLKRLKIKPLLLGNIQWNHAIMQEEVFGPVLPLMVYHSKEDIANELIHQMRPLNMYVFSNNDNFIKSLLKNVRSGNVSINQCLLNYTECNLPFGGDHHSGIGKYHGYFGFIEFSHQRSVSRQSKIPSTLKLFYPPYKQLKIKLMNLLIKLYS